METVDVKQEMLEKDPLVFWRRPRNLFMRCRMTSLSSGSGAAATIGRGML